MQHPKKRHYLSSTFFLIACPLRPVCTWVANYKAASPRSLVAFKNQMGFIKFSVATKPVWG
jgi:hypothetical protein